MLNEVNTEKLKKLLNAAENIDSSKINEIKNLLKNGADPNILTKRGETGLFIAHSENNVVLWDLFVHFKADPAKRNVNGDTVLHRAVRIGRVKSEEFFSHIVDDCLSALNVTNKSGRTPLVLSFISGDKFKSLILIEHGANVNIADEKGHTPLIEALDRRWDDIATMLVEKGADVSARGQNDAIPLLIAMLYSNLEMCKILLEYGANVNMSIGNTSNITLLRLGLSCRNKPIQRCFHDWIQIQLKFDAITIADVANLDANLSQKFHNILMS